MSRQKTLKSARFATKLLPKRVLPSCYQTDFGLRADRGGSALFLLRGRATIPVSVSIVIIADQSSFIAGNMLRPETQSQSGRVRKGRRDVGTVNQSGAKQFLQEAPHILGPHNLFNRAVLVT